MPYPSSVSCYATTRKYLPTDVLLVSIVSSFASDHFGLRGATTIAYSLFTVIGFAMFLGTFSSYGCLSFYLITRYRVFH